MKKSTYITIAMSFALVFSQVITLPAAQAATKGWRYWGYFQAAPGATKWTAAMIKGEDVFINGDGETSRDFCYIDNVVQANLLAALSGKDAANAVYKRFKALRASFKCTSL